ncbi:MULTISPECIES: heme exporter protein CcmB [unclassified Methylibium]|jgi:heme exporter protein B|uniref:heme exporter protein CcmB n=1 Tax=unclassified Methylibium TaxID=2633235 RepID=UPI0006F40D91|nr:heme exporter protein CcmB [Methylibium sp. Root1272]KQW66755.1 heme ABC transporter permease [Methylibium sp. Root1272]
MRDLFLAVYLRDLRLAMRRRVETLMPVAFFVVTASLFPLGVGPEPQILRQLAPGLAWVCALLAAMLSVSQLYASDFADGSLEQMLLTGHSAVVIAAAKSAAHWTLSGLPLIAAAPLLGLLFDMHRDALGTLVVSLLLGTPVLSLLGSVGAALTLGLRSAGVLLLLLVLPLTIPALIFGTGAVAAVDAGQSPGGHFSILGALLILTALTAPLATAAALRISLE